MGQKIKVTLQEAADNFMEYMKVQRDLNEKHAKEIGYLKKRSVSVYRSIARMVTDRKTLEANQRHEIQNLRDRVEHLECMANSLSAEEVKKGLEWARSEEVKEDTRVRDTHKPMEGKAFYGDLDYSRGDDFEQAMSDFNDLMAGKGPRRSIPVQPNDTDMIFNRIFDRFAEMEGAIKSVAVVAEAYSALEPEGSKEEKRWNDLREYMSGDAPMSRTMNFLVSQKKDFGGF